MQRVTLSDGVVLCSDTVDHPNRCYSWVGERSLGVAAALVALSKPDTTFLDCGSFAGQHAIRLAKVTQPLGTSIAVEPNPNALKWLRRNISASGSPMNIRVIEGAVAASGGVGRFAPDKLSLSHLTSDGAIFVRTMSLDQLIETWSPDLIKIDIEGGDADVINAATLLDPRKHSLVCENNAGVQDALRNKGFNVDKIADLVPASVSGTQNVSDDVVALSHTSDRRHFLQVFAKEIDRLSATPAVTFGKVQ